ncbi:MAG: zeta toxin family protein [Victivallales bacterium]|nr:zeta toxin family protein [Victivallales bacterium]
MESKKPTCYIVAGPNGAGKTTFSLSSLSKITNCTRYINVDEIARGLSPLDVASVQIKAGRLFLEMLKDLVAQRENFTFETTLSGRSYLQHIQRWQADGWRVILFFLYVPSAQLCESRVAARVAAGGHNVPGESIIRRYSRSIRNLFEFAETCDRTFCLDNSSSRPVPIFEKAKGKPYHISNQTLFDKMQKECSL